MRHGRALSARHIIMNSCVTVGILVPTIRTAEQHSIVGAVRFPVVPNLYPKVAPKRGADEEPPHLAKEVGHEELVALDEATELVHDCECLLHLERLGAMEMERVDGT